LSNRCVKKESVLVKKAATAQARTWFGLDGTVVIGPGFVHKAGLCGILIPHPPGINWMLRQGLTENARTALSFTHEFGHLQATPAALGYAGVMLAVTLSAAQASLLKILLVLISAHAGWEIMAELFAVISNYETYRKSYEGVKVHFRIVFWTLITSLTIAGWIIAFS
jgi:hypothetical protein